MPPEKIAEANQLLAKPPVVGLALSRALGLHVVASLAARHGITVELRPGAPVGLVALVTLPSTILEREAAPAAPPLAPVFAPHVGPDGQPTPLGARRVAWRPPDEPPVEEWRAEGLVDPEPAIAPDGDAPGRRHRASPRARADRGRARRTCGGSAGRRADCCAGAPTSTFSKRRRCEAPSFDGPPFEVRSRGRRSNEPPVRRTVVEEPLVDAPLPIRVPGHHLSHQPTVVGDEPVSVADPLRPYRVHELLTRHDLGKRRGRAEHDGDSGSPAPEPHVARPAMARPALGG